MLLGAGAFILGVIIAAITYSRAEAESNYMLAWAPILLGIGALSLGWSNSAAPALKARRSEEALRRNRDQSYRYFNDPSGFERSQLDEKETDIIRELFLQYTGVKLEDDSLEKLVRQAKAVTPTI